MSAKRTPGRRIAYYEEAVNWIARNEDCEWILDGDETDDYFPSITASMVIDLFEVGEDRIIGDIRSAVMDAWPELASKYGTAIAKAKELKS